MRAATRTTSDRTTSDNQSMAAQLMAGIVGSPSDCSARTTLERTGGFRGSDHDQLAELIPRSSSEEDQFATERQNWCTRPILWLVARRPSSAPAAARRSVEGELLVRVAKTFPDLPWP